MDDAGAPPPTSFAEQDAHVAKPVAPERLLSAIEDGLRARHAGQ